MLLIFAVSDLLRLFAISDLLCVHQIRLVLNVREMSVGGIGEQRLLNVIGDWHRWNEKRDGRNSVGFSGRNGRYDVIRSRERNGIRVGWRRNGFERRGRGTGGKDTGLDVRGERAEARDHVRTAVEGAVEKSEGILANDRVDDVVDLDGVLEAVTVGTVSVHRIFVFGGVEAGGYSAENNTENERERSASAKRERSTYF